MPLYEYVCEQCSHQFEELIFGDATPGCPSCKAMSVRRIMSVVSVGRSSEQARAEMPGPCGTCSDPRGPGACPLANNR